MEICDNSCSTDFCTSLCGTAVCTEAQMMYNRSVTIIAQYHNICGLDCPSGYIHGYDWFADPAQSDWCKKFKRPEPEPEPEPPSICPVGSMYDEGFTFVL